MFKLLLVDDERIIRQGIEASLPMERLGLVLTASCGNAFDALDSMQNDMPDLLITDVKMPHMDGLELIERALTLNPALQCIVLSGYDEFTFAKRAMSLGVREYLLKPFYKEELIATLERICTQLESTRARTRSLLSARAEQTAELAERLLMLTPGENAAGVTTAQVSALVREYGGEDMLREAYTYLIAHQESQPARGFAAIRQTYHSETELIEIVAKGLTALLSRQGQRPFIQHMCEYIRTHYADANLSLQQIADHVIHMRADYIGREFSKEMGMKISDYLLRVRMERAKQLLCAVESEKHIYDVARQVGLGHNPQYFSRLFRKYAGVTPKEFIRQRMEKEGKRPPQQA